MHRKKTLAGRIYYIAHCIADSVRSHWVARSIENKQEGLVVLSVISTVHDQNIITGILHHEKLRMSVALRNRSGTNLLADCYLPDYIEITVINHNPGHIAVCRAKLSSFGVVRHALLRGVEFVVSVKLKGYRICFCLLCFRIVCKHFSSVGEAERHPGIKRVAYLEYARRLKI